MLSSARQGGSVPLHNAFELGGPHIMHITPQPNQLVEFDDSLDRNRTTSYDRIVVVGLGYIGLPTAAILASRGKEVVGIDVNRDAVDTINKGKIHIVEPDLDIVVRSTVTTGNLRATTQPEPADAFIIAVPTPFQDGHKPDLSYIEAAVKSIASVLEPGNLVILESTSPVGTTEQLAKWIEIERPDLFASSAANEKSRISIAYCPERVLPGRVLNELVSNDRIIGGITPECAEAATRLYQTFVSGNCIQTTARTAELCKLVENAYRDVNIAYANELSLICDDLEIDVWELIELANRHPRVNILKPGPGVGGHCIAVDPWFIVDTAPDQARLIRTAREVNDGKPHHVVEHIKRMAKKFRNPVIACFGVAYKENIDDLRESPSLGIVERLANDNVAQLLVVEPNIRQLPTSLEGKEGVELVGIEEAWHRSDIVVGMVSHAQFDRTSQEKLKEKVVIDVGGVWR